MLKEVISLQEYTPPFVFSTGAIDLRQLHVRAMSYHFLYNIDVGSGPGDLAGPFTFYGTNDIRAAADEKNGVDLSTGGLTAKWVDLTSRLDPVPDVAAG